jgi:hypothetical protein
MPELKVMTTVDVKVDSNLLTVMSGIKRGKLSLRIADGLIPLPSWADWLIWLGSWMRCQAEMTGRRVAVVRLPSRRLSAAFVGLGALLAAVRTHNDSLDWESLQALPKGSTVHWRVVQGDKTTRYAGTVKSVELLEGSKFLAISITKPLRNNGSTFLLPKGTALSYGVTLGSTTARTDKQHIATAALFSFLVEGASQTWIRSSGTDGMIVTEQSSFLDDLTELTIATDHSIYVPFLEALTLSSSEIKQHGKLQLVSTRSELFQENRIGLTVLDGSAASMNLPISKAQSVIILLDHSEYDEEFVHLMNPFFGNSSNEGVHIPPEGVISPPEGVEIFIFALPEKVGAGS